MGGVHCADIPLLTSLLLLLCLQHHSSPFNLVFIIEKKCHNLLRPQLIGLCLHREAEIFALLPLHFSRTSYTTEVYILGYYRTHDTFLLILLFCYVVPPVFSALFKSMLPNPSSCNITNPHLSWTIFWPRVRETLAVPASSVHDKSYPLLSSLQFLTIFWGLKFVVLRSITFEITRAHTAWFPRRRTIKRFKAATKGDAPAAILH